MKVCTHCRASNAQQASRCGECGQALPASPPTGGPTISQRLTNAGPLPADDVVPVRPRRQHLVLLVDSSGSMGSQIDSGTKAEVVARQITGFSEELRRLIQNTRDHIFVSLIEFADGATTRFRLTDVMDMPAHYDVTPSGKTNISAALEQAIEAVKEAEKDKQMPSVLVLMSDGQNNVDHNRTPMEVVGEIQKMSVQVARPNPNALQRRMPVPIFAAALWGGDEDALRQTLGHSELVVSIQRAEDIRTLLLRVSTKAG